MFGPTAASEDYKPVSTWMAALVFRPAVQATPAAKLLLVISNTPPWVWRHAICSFTVTCESVAACGDQLPRLTRLHR